MIKLPLRDSTEYEISEEFSAELEKVYRDVDLELQAMRVWLLANDAKRKTRRGIKRFVVNWLNTAGKRRPRTMPESLLKTERTVKTVMPQFVRDLIDKMRK